MDSRDSDEEMAPHHPAHLSSLVVRPTDSGGGGGAAATGSDYEPGEVRRGDPPPYSRSDRLGDNHGYRMRAGSASPVRRRAADRHYSPEFDHAGGQPRIRGFGRGGDPPRYRDYSPPFGGRGRHGGRFGGRGFDGSGFGPSRGDGMPRNNPNVRPREGDWICSDPRCQNLNFARRDSCNNCNRPRYGAGGSPRRGYGGPLPSFARRFPGLPMDRSPGRATGGYRSPPRSWARDGPRELGLGGPPHPRRDSRFFYHPIRRDGPDYLQDDLRERTRLEKPIPPLDWGRERERDGMNDRKAYERRPLSPPLPLQPPPPRGRWPHYVRERSRSPIRELLPLKDFRRDIYMERGRDDRRALGRERIGNAY